MSDHYDVIIIGTGAGGGTLLNKLAPSGQRITVRAAGLRHQGRDGAGR
jgi:choline dehydrogenase-like flavoprotein